MPKVPSTTSSRPATGPGDALATANILLRQRLRGSVDAVRMLESQIETIAGIGAVVIERLEAGGTLFTAGNGGSAAQAAHLSEELIGRYRSTRPPIRAICLNADPAALTCIANDFGFEEVFARPCTALLTTRDVLLVLSTSGRSRNIIRALQAAHRIGATTIGLLGRDGGDALRHCDHAVVVPLEDSAHIQDAHQVVIHLLCELVEAHGATARGTPPAGKP
jgi:D-sedoheptulose 7-phosphate isomerase